MVLRVIRPVKQFTDDEIRLVIRGLAEDIANHIVGSQPIGRKVLEAKLERMSDLANYLSDREFLYKE